MINVNESEAVEMAGSIPGWMEELNLRWLFTRAAAIPEGERIVELGCWLGRSTCMLLLGHPYPADIHVVDTFRGSKSEPPECFVILGEDPEKIFRENMARYAGMLPHIIIDDSSAAASSFSDNSIFLVFIDASHDYESVFADISAWRPKLKPEGIMAGHDWGYEPIERAIDQLLGRKNIEACGNGRIWCYRKPGRRQNGQ